MAKKYISIFTIPAHSYNPNTIYAIPAEELVEGYEELEESIIQSNRYTILQS